MALAILLLPVLLFPLLALATFTPRPVEAALVLIGLGAAVLTALVTGDGFLAACAFLLPTASGLTLVTVGQTAGQLGAARARERERRRRRRRRRSLALELAADDDRRPARLAGL